MNLEAFLFLWGLGGVVMAFFAIGSLPIHENAPVGAVVIVGLGAAIFAPVIVPALAIYGLGRLGIVMGTGGRYWVNEARRALRQRHDNKANALPRARVEKR